MVDVDVIIMVIMTIVSILFPITLRHTVINITVDVKRVETVAQGCGAAALEEIWIGIVGAGVVRIVVVGIKVGARAVVVPTVLAIVVMIVLGDILVGKAAVVLAVGRVVLLIVLVVNGISEVVVNEVVVVIAVVVEIVERVGELGVVLYIHFTALHFFLNSRMCGH